ncbi:hypothetical protein AAC03nite_28130 [Alicyclobacillus acidoterrestris]|nr:hypothetical protein AAC03nite_28130 [Alicyclobacillus acidoterrestris]
MLTYKQIVQAVTEKLQSQFPSIPVLQEDVGEGSANSGSGFQFERPSFKVLFDSASRDERLYNSLRTATCRIYFFPTSLYNYSLEFLDTLDGLETAFGLNLQVQDRTITITESRNEQIGDATQTKVLEFDFDIQWYDDPAHPQSESPYKMEELDLDFTDE